MVARPQSGSLVVCGRFRVDSFLRRRLTLFSHVLLYAPGAGSEHGGRQEAGGRRVCVAGVDDRDKPGGYSAHRGLAKRPGVENYPLLPFTFTPATPTRTIFPSARDRRRNRSDPSLSLPNRPASGWHRSEGRPLLVPKNEPGTSRAALVCEAGARESREITREVCSLVQAPAAGRLLCRDHDNMFF